MAASTDGAPDPSLVEREVWPIKFIPALVVGVMFCFVVLAVAAIGSLRRAPFEAGPLVLTTTPVDGEAPARRETLPADALFEFDRAELKPGADGPIRAFAARVKSRDDLQIVVIGHSDPLGRVPHNDRLSLARANAVRAVLVADGVDARRVSTAGVGSRVPLKQHADCPGREDDPAVRACLEPDRRVELWTKTVEAR